MISKRNIKEFCKEDFERIENYEKAIADNNQTWHCHHRLETHTSDGEKRLVSLSKLELIELGMYYYRPAEELIFLTKSEHAKLHNLTRVYSDETKKKISESNKGKRHSEKTKIKMSESHKEKPSPMKSKKRTDEFRKKVSDGHKGKTHSTETRQKMSENSLSPIYKEYKLNGGTLNWNDFQKEFSKKLKN